MLNELEQKIYNTHLAVVRTAQGQPFTLRKDFSDITEDHPSYHLVKKLARFFEKYPQVDMRDYFMAPYQIYREKDHYGLDFYVKQKAISLYSMYVKRLDLLSPDDAQQLNSIKSSLSFIIRFCHERKIKFTEYLEYKEPEATIEAFLGHYKERKVSMYVLLSFPRFERMMYSLDDELKALFFGDVIDDVTKYKIKLHQSRQAKQLIQNTFRQATIALH